MNFVALVNWSLMMGFEDNAGDALAVAVVSVSCKSEFHSSPNVPFQIDHSLPILSWCFSHFKTDGDVGHNFEVIKAQF